MKKQWHCQNAKALMLALICAMLSAHSYAMGGSGQTFDYGGDGKVVFKDNSTDTQTIEVTAGGLAKWAAEDADDISEGNTNWAWFDESYRPEAMKYTKLVITGTLNADDIAVLNNTHWGKFTVVNLEGVTLAEGTDGSALATTQLTGAEYVSLPQGLTKNDVKAFGEAYNNHSAFKSAISYTDGGTNFIGYVNDGGSLATCIENTTADQENIRKSVQYLTVMGTPLPIDYAGGLWPATDDAGAQLDDDGHVSVTVDVTPRQVSLKSGPNATKTLNQLNWTFKGAGIVSLDLGDAIIERNEDLTLNVLGYQGESNELKYLVLPKVGYTEIIKGSFANLKNLQSVYMPPTVKAIRTGAFFGDPILYHIYTSGDGENTRYDNGAVTEVAADGTETKYYGADVIDQPLVYGTWTLPSSLEMIETQSFSAEHVKDVYVLATVAPECQVDAFGTRMYTGNNGYDPTVISSAGIVTREAYFNNTTSSGGNVYCWITMLHFPASIGTPEVQHYTDPTRQYSIATGLKDDRGNVIYFPTQDEWNRAYSQGTYGYVWNAWDPERIGTNNAINYLGLHGANGWSAEGQQTANAGYKSTWVEGVSPYTSFYDVTNNGAYPQPDGLEYYYNVYWDERALNNQGNGTQLYPQAEASTDYYYSYLPATLVDFENGIQLYSKSGDEYLEASPTTYADGYYKRVQTHKHVDGKPQFEQCDNGHYVKVDGYEPKADGEYVQVATFAGYESTTTPVEGVTTYYSDEAGTTATPKVGTGFYYLSGSEPKYSQVDKNTEVIGARDQYYTKNGETYTPSNLRFYYWQDFRPLYYGTDLTEEKDVYSQTSSPISGVSTYYEDENGTHDVTPIMNGTYFFDPITAPQTSYVATTKPVSGVTTYYTLGDGSDVETAPLLATSYWGNNCETFYYDSNNVPVTVTHYDPSITTYYVKWSYGQIQEWTSQLEFANTVYYKKTEDVTTYSSSNEWQGEKTYYSYGWHTNESGQNVEGYYVVNPSFNGTYYYVSDTQTVPVYGSSDIFIEGKTWYTYDANSKTYTQVTLDWNNYFSGETYYYVDGTQPVYSSAEGQDYNATTAYYTDNTGATEAQTVTFDKTYYYPVYEYTYETYTDQEGERYTKVDVYREGTAEELAAAATRYCPVMEDVKFYPIVKTNDYRGWHQFILTGYSANTTVPETYERTYTKDDDWWTICLPYDLTRKEMMKLFSNGTKVPYLSKLMYVTRNVDEGKIYLCFSKNLMENREDIEVTYDSDGFRTSPAVHGSTDANGILKIKDGIKPLDDDVVLFAGVPYLIKPSIPADGQHQFSFYLTEIEEGKVLTDEEKLNNSLYHKIEEAQKLKIKQNDLIYAGVYTVPALVYNNTTGGEATDGTDIIIGTQTYQKSTKFTYSFVGTFFKSLLPQYCYFLGESKGKAAFWYNRVNDPANWTWSNQTGIICANYNTNKKITLATDFNNPARWEIVGGTDLVNDDFESGATGAKMLPTMLFGVDGGMDEISGIAEVKAETKDAQNVYNVNGMRVGDSVKGLAKGLYIVNGKKIVVK